MSVETALYPPQLNTAWPLSSDMVSEGDDHIRLLKIVDKTTWRNVAGAVDASHIELNYIVGVTSPLQGQINGKGAISGQTWSGPHVFNGSIAVPTLAQATSTTGAASTAFVQNEWATRLPNYTGPITASTTELNRVVGVTSGVQAQIDSKGAIAGQTWTGTHVFPNATTVGPLTPTIQGYLATATSDVQAQINTKAAKAGDTYTGTHNFTGVTAITVPTLTTGSAGNNAASVDFVNATALSGALPGQVGNSGKFITTDGANASWQWPQIPAVVHTTGGVLQVGRLNILNCTGQTFTLPASFQDNDTFGFVHISTNSENSIDWGSRNLFGRQPLVMNLYGNNVRGYVRWSASAGSFV